MLLMSWVILATFAAWNTPPAAGSEPPAKGAAQSKITLTLSTNTLVFGQPLTLSASLSPAAASGRVTFYDATSVLGTSSVTRGTAVFTTRLLSTGSHSLFAYYSGNGAYSPSSSGKIVGTVTALPASGFEAAASYNTEPLPYSIALADFNNDGKVDFVVVCASSGTSSTVDVHLGNGDGTFGPSISTASSPGAEYVVAIDFNNDGKTDIATSNATGVETVLLGNGDGTFQQPVDYPSGTYLNASAVGDFNRDGIPDLAVLNNANGVGPGGLSILLGNGDGTFQAAVSYPAGSQPNSLVVADLNGDGIADLAVADIVEDGYISILLGLGDGTFSAPVTYSTGGASPAGIAAEDLNGDGAIDLVVSNIYSNNLSVLLGRGDGTLQPPVLYPVGNNPYGISLGDVNGDAETDLVVAVYDGSGPPGGVGVLLGNGDGSFQEPVYYGTGGASLQSAIGDFNGDGRADILINNQTSQTASVILGVPLPAPTITTLRSSPNPSQYSTTVTLTSTVSPLLATGVVTFYDGSSALGSSNLSHGSALLTISTLTVGSHSLTASYAGDPNDLPSVSAPVTQVVRRAATQATLISAPNPSNYLQRVTLTATISPAQATGSVKFLDGATTLGTVAVSGGTAVLNTAKLSVGSHLLQAVYSGDSNYSGATSATVSQVVQPLATTTSLTTSPDPSALGKSVTMTAQVSPAAALGSVTFFDGSTTLGTSTVNSGTATFVVTALSLGSHSLTAAYSGSADYVASTSPVVKQLVVK